MPTGVDRMQIAVRDGAATEETVRELLGAEMLREGRSELPRARRRVLQAGTSEFELPEPVGLRCSAVVCW